MAPPPTDDYCHFYNNHDEVAQNGYYKQITSRTYHLSVQAVPSYPGVSLWLRGQTAAKAFCMVIPADASVLSTTMTGKEDKEIIMDMKCTNKTAPTELRFLLANLFETGKVLFTIANGW